MQEHAFVLRTNRFNATETKPNFINERCFGEDFASWLQGKLIQAEMEVSEPIQEDWGWCLVAVEAGKTFTVSIGGMDDPIGQGDAQWRVGISYERPMNGLMGLFRPVPMGLLEEAGAKLHAVLAAEPSFWDLQAES